MGKTPNRSKGKSKGRSKGKRSKKQSKGTLISKSEELHKAIHSNTPEINSSERFDISYLERNELPISSSSQIKQFTIEISIVAHGTLQTKGEEFIMFEPKIDLSIFSNIKKGECSVLNSYTENDYRSSLISELDNLPTSRIVPDSIFSGIINKTEQYYKDELKRDLKDNKTTLTPNLEKFLETSTVTVETNNITYEYIDKNYKFFDDKIQNPDFKFGIFMLKPIRFSSGFGIEAGQNLLDLPEFQEFMLDSHGKIIKSWGNGYHIVNKNNMHKEPITLSEIVYFFETLFNEYQEEIKLNILDRSCNLIKRRRPTSAGGKKIFLRDMSHRLTHKNKKK